MPKVVVFTDDGRQVASFEGQSIDLLSAYCPMNRRGSSIVSGVRRAMRDAEEIQAGRDPERPSEKVMRMVAEARGDTDA